MSNETMRAEFEAWLERDGRFKLAKRETIGAMWQAYQAARAQSAEPVAVGEMPCDCIEKEGRFYQQRCDCGNSGDMIEAQQWCDAANKPKQRRLEPIGWVQVPDGEQESSHYPGYAWRGIKNLSPGNHYLYTHPPAREQVPESIRRILVAALEVAKDRDGDVPTEDGERATTSVDDMIELETALADAFSQESDDVEPVNAAQAIETLAAAPQPPAQDWFLYGERLPDEDDEDCEGNVWNFMPGRSSAPMLTTAGETRRRYETGIVVHWKPTALTRPQPPEDV